MRVLVVLAVTSLTAGLCACMMPRPWLAPQASDVCRPGQTLSADVVGPPILVATFRAPDCSGEGVRWTVYRSAEPQFALVGNNETQLVTRKAWFDSLPTSGPAPVIYIHGYFNDEGDAMRRASAIRVLLCGEADAKADAATCLPRRPVIALTWPSFNAFAKYTWDEANSEWAQEYAPKLIMDIAQAHPGTTLIAHSMGNRILVAAALAAKGRVQLERLVLASPDVDRDTMAGLLAQPDGLGFPATIYASRKDQALSASWRTHGAPRAGDLSFWVSGRAPGYPYRKLGTAQIVDTTDLHAGMTGHAAFIETPEAAADLCHVLAGEPTPRRERDAKYSAYWVLRDIGVAGDSCEKRALAAVEIANAALNRYPPGRRSARSGAGSGP